jgi:hypothetical protein
MQNSRECQPCTACCDGWLQIKVKGCEAYPGKPCPHSTGSGCDDYQNRPKNPCQTFECNWVKSGSHLPEDFRPDLAGVIVVERILTWQGLDVDLATPVGKEIPEKSLAWLKAYAEQHIRPLIYQQQPPNRRKYVKDPLTLAHGPPAFQQWLEAKIASGEKLW